jgi:hypothetical protein
VTALDKIIIGDVKARMAARHRIKIRQSMYDRMQDRK